MAHTIESILSINDDVLEENVTIPIDSEAISITAKTTKRVQDTLIKCFENNNLTDTFAIDHLLEKLSSENVRVLSCMSPIDQVGLPFIRKYLKKVHVHKKNILCIPLCDGVHFQGYVIDVSKRELIHVDSLQPANEKNPISEMIAKVLFDQKDVAFKSFFSTRVQFDSNSCGVWLIAAMVAYVHSLPKPSVRSDAFDIAFSLLERKSEFHDKNMESEIPSSKNWKSEDHINIYASAKFLIDVLRNDPVKSNFYTETLTKGIRSNYFYITDTTKCPMSQITADDNGAYIKTRNTNKLYCEVGENVNIVHMDGDKYFYNTRYSNTYTRSYVPINDVVMLKRSYCVSKSLPLSRTIVSLAAPADGPIIPHVAVFYQARSNVTESTTIQSHGNAKRTNATSKPYYRTSNDVLTKAKKYLKIGMQPKSVYDKINDESGGVYESISQGQELRDTRQVYRQKVSVKKEPHDDLSNVIRLQSESCEFIRTISITGKSYQVFLGNDVQLKDVEQFCCNKSGVLSVDTTFNLCDSWVTDTCYYNKRLENSDGNNPVFLGPTLIHFQKDSSIFRRFLLEMCAHNPNIRELHTIGTDQEMAIFNGFSSILPNINLLLCVYHLEQGDKQKISNLVHQKGAKQSIIADIYGCRYGGVQEYGLADSTDPDDFHAKLESLQEKWDNQCPGFHKWFCEKRKLLFNRSVIESARSGTAVQGLFYNNSIECQHFREKLEQSYKKGSLETVISTLQKLVERQENDEIKAIYGSGPYSLSKQYVKFQIDSVKWHSMDGDGRRKHVNKFRMYKPTLGDEYVKPKKSGKKPSDGGRRIRKQEAEVIVDRHAKRTRIDDPNCEPEIPFELFFRSLVPRLVERCQGSCGQKLSQSKEEDYLLIKSNGPTTFMVNGEERTKVGPQYVHFNQKCLKEYLQRKHNVQVNRFPYDRITIDRRTLNKLTDKECEYLSGYGVHMPRN